MKHLANLLMDAQEYLKTELIKRSILNESEIQTIVNEKFCEGKDEEMFSIDTQR